MNAKTIAWIVLVIAGALVVRALFPKTVTVPGVPRIETRYDTVRTIDTAWVTRLRRDTVRVNVTERVTVTIPETLYVLPAPTHGITAFAAGAKVGDSTLVAGFSLQPLDSGMTRRDWRVQFYTLGPVKSMVLDSLPRISFYAPPGKPCGFFCKAGHYAVGAALGASLMAVLK